MHITDVSIIDCNPQILTHVKYNACPSQTALHDDTSFRLSRLRGDDDARGLGMLNCNFAVIIALLLFDFFRKPVFHEPWHQHCLPTYEEDLTA